MRDKKKKNVLILMLAGVMIFTSGCGTLYENGKAGYTKVNSVEGVTFEMPENVLSAATAVTNISQETDYGQNTYLYKDGKSTYLLFNMASLVVAVNNTTNYNLPAADNVEAALLSESLNGIWFAPEGKTLDYKKTESKGAYKLIADVVGDVSVTTTLYGKFVGKFAYIKTGTYEVSMFVGIPGTAMDSISSKKEKIIDYIAKSFIADAESMVDIPKPTEESKDSEPEEETEDTLTEQKTPIIEVTEVIKRTEEQEEIHATEVSVPEPVTNSKDTFDETGSVTDERKESFASVDSNQHQTEGGTYSDVYHLLKIGNTGVLSTRNTDTELATAYITMNKLYTGDEAKNIIRDYCKTDVCQYEYEDAPAGYSWQVMEYTLDTSPENLYVNIKIEGLDGEKLKYNGIAVSSRTHDIFAYGKHTDKGYEKLYCYYAVPNGCKEYMLECGERITDTSDTACFVIKDF